MGPDKVFHGAKMALFVGDRLAVILRDDFEGLSYAGCWDFPGGGREGEETPLACAQRECAEELTVHVPEAAIVWRQAYSADGQDSWFFVAQMPASAADDIVLGDEGQRWALMTVQEFLGRTAAVGFLQDRLRAYLARV